MLCIFFIMALHRRLDVDRRQAIPSAQFAFGTMACNASGRAMRNYAITAGADLIEVNSCPGFQRKF